MSDVWWWRNIELDCDLFLKKKHLSTLISTFTCLETHNSPVGAGIESSDYKADLLTRNVTIDLIILAYF